MYKYDALESIFMINSFYPRQQFILYSLNESCKIVTSHLQPWCLHDLPIQRSPRRMRQAGPITPVGQDGLDA